MIKLITRELIMSFNPCRHYPANRIAELVPEAGVYACDAGPGLLALPPDDCRWLLAKLLPLESRVLWAEACARRAQGYARTASAAAYAAVDADAACDAADDEHRLAVAHALELLSKCAR
jgi:hypothetical protein